jgi:hypothetical protein
MEKATERLSCFKIIQCFGTLFCRKETGNPLIYMVLYKWSWNYINNYILIHWIRLNLHDADFSASICKEISLQKEILALILQGNVHGNKIYKKMARNFVVKKEIRIYTLPIITSQLHCFQLRTTLNGKDFKFFSHGLCRTSFFNTCIKNIFLVWPINVEISFNTKTILVFVLMLISIFIDQNPKFVFIRVLKKDVLLLCIAHGGKNLKSFPFN